MYDLNAIIDREYDHQDNAQYDDDLDPLSGYFDDDNEE